MPVGFYEVDVFLTGGSINFNTAVPVDGTPPYTRDAFPADGDGIISFSRGIIRSVGRSGTASV
jgi:hypothetical protein